MFGITKFLSFATFTGSILSTSTTNSTNSILFNQPFSNFIL